MGNDTKCNASKGHFSLFFMHSCAHFEQKNKFWAAFRCFPFVYLYIFVFGIRVNLKLFHFFFFHIYFSPSLAEPLYYQPGKLQHKTLSTSKTICTCELIQNNCFNERNESHSILLQSIVVVIRRSLLFLPFLANHKCSLNAIRIKLKMKNIHIHIET